MRDGKPHRNLEVWRAGIELVKIIYEITSNFPEEEEFGLISQIKRAASSIDVQVNSIGVSIDVYSITHTQTRTHTHTYTPNPL